MTDSAKKENAPDPPRQCANCLWYKANAQKKDATGLCTMEPPQVFFVPQAASSIQIAGKDASATLGVMTYFPSVAAASRCRHHQYADDGGEAMPEEVLADASQQQGESLANIAVSLDQLKTEFGRLIKLLQYTPTTGGKTGN